MGIGTRQPGAKFAFLSSFSPASGASHGQGLLLGDFHGHIMCVSPQNKLVNIDQSLF
jgi:hypothetical protein